VIAATQPVCCNEKQPQQQQAYLAGACLGLFLAGVSREQIAEVLGSDPDLAISLAVRIYPVNCLSTQPRSVSKLFERGLCFVVRPAQHVHPQVLAGGLGGTMRACCVIWHAAALPDSLHAVSCCSYSVILLASGSYCIKAVIQAAVMLQNSPSGAV
jgi:hypothetical protein